MSYTVIARRYRPKTFREVVGQEAIAQTLENSIKEKRVAHAYLFCGPRGVGKTSMARILAKALNCVKGESINPCNKCEICVGISDSNDADVIEMDAASNRKVEDIRDLRENVRYAPLRAKYKIYIVDEAHMLTREAFNAFLKTLEEPPPHVKFIFATTEPHKLPDTIQSRCQRFDFRRITIDDIVKRLGAICKEEKIKYSQEALQLISTMAKGSMRDSQSVLEQAISFSKDELNVKKIEDIFGIIPQKDIQLIFQAIKEENYDQIISITEKGFKGGADTLVFIDQLLSYLNELMIQTANKSAKNMGEKDFSIDQIVYFVNALSEARLKLKELPEPTILLETMLIKFARYNQFVDLVSLANGLSELKTSKNAPVIRCNNIDKQPSVKHDTQENNTVDDMDTEIELDWEKILEEIKQKKPSITACLKDAKLKIGDKDTLNIVYGRQYLFHKKLVEEAENIGIIKESIEKIEKKSYNVVVRFEGGKANGEDPAPIEEPSSKKKEIDVDQIEDRSVKNITKLFKGRIIELED